MRTNRPKSRAGRSLVRLLVVISIVGVLVVGLVLPAVKKAAHRSPLWNNLQEQALVVFSYLGAYDNLSSSFGPSTGTPGPWQKQPSPYLEHQGSYSGYGQPSRGTLLPWQKPTSPYVDHQGL